MRWWDKLKRGPFNTPQMKCHFSEKADAYSLSLCLWLWIDRYQVMVGQFERFRLFYLCYFCESCWMRTERTNKTKKCAHWVLRLIAVTHIQNINQSVQKSSFFFVFFRFTSTLIDWSDKNWTVNHGICTIIRIKWMKLWSDFVKEITCFVHALEQFGWIYNMDIIIIAVFLWLNSI